MMYTQMLYEVSKSPVGSATAKGVEIAAKVGLMAGREAVKVMVPAAGRIAAWAVQQGGRAALGALQGKRRDERKREEGNKKG